MPAPNTRRRPKKVYTIRTDQQNRNWWRQIGVAWENADGSLNVILDALPLDGKLQIRDDPESLEQGNRRSFGPPNGEPFNAKDDDDDIPFG